MKKSTNKSKKNYGDVSNYLNTKEELILARKQEVERDILPGFFTKFKGVNIESISARERVSRMSKY